jgi:hypothetical protein
MIRRRRQDARPQPTVATTEGAPFDAFHQWVLSLPWVVERPFDAENAAVRTFAVDCEPLGRRRVWLVTGLDPDFWGEGTRLGVIVPAESAEVLEELGWGRFAMPMPDGHVLVTIDHPRNDPRPDVEALVLSAYGYAMA